MTDSVRERAQVDVDRPVYPHLDNLERVIVRDPDFLDRQVTVTEKIHGFNVRVGRDRDGTPWYGSRNQAFDLSDPDANKLNGFKEYADSAVREVGAGVTLYGEWAGKGVQGGIDYGEKTFYLFGERVGGGPVSSAAGVLDQHWVDLSGGRGFIAHGESRRGLTTVPVIYEGPSARLDVLDELRRGESIVAPGQPIEGVVIAPVSPVFDVYGHQVIAKYKSPKFSELTHVRKEHKVVDMSRATDFASEYVNDERLRHVLLQVVETHETTEHHGQVVVVNIDPLDVRHTGAVLKAMYLDVIGDGQDDFDKLAVDDQKLVGKAINKETLALLDLARSGAAREADEARQR